MIVTKNRLSTNNNGNLEARVMLASVNVSPGTDNLQSAIDSVSDSGGGSVNLSNGNYYLTESITPRSNVDILGDGFGTVLQWHSSVQSNINEPMIYSNGELEDVSFKDFKLRGSVNDFNNDTNRTGMMGIFLDGDGTADDPSSMDLQGIEMRRVEVRNFGGTGVHIKGVNKLRMYDNKLNLNGVATNDLHHNFYTLRANNVRIDGGTFNNSPDGHGMRFDRAENVVVESVQVQSNGDHGVHLTRNDNFTIKDSTVRNNAQSPRGAAADIGNFGSNSDVTISNVKFS